MDYLARILCDTDEIQVSYSYQTIIILLLYQMEEYYDNIINQCFKLFFSSLIVNSCLLRLRIQL